MKFVLTLSFSMLLAAPAAWSNGESLSLREEAQVRDAALEKKSQAQKTRQRMEDNPRNPAMVESFENVSDEKAKKLKEKQEKD